uniref:LIM zinc-binding domain-containing protein n=1 Tax=Panagrolaimus sp. ES5 TaxID=591445 RepID=A0AC34F4X8_9BILA
MLRHLCDVCLKPIGDAQALLVNDKLVHLSHFKCHLCQKSIEASDSFHSLPNRKYSCLPCFSSRIAPKCYKCGEGITQNGVTAAEKNWHSNCLRCSKCQRLLFSTFLFDKKGDPIDHDCFWGERLQKIVADSYKA